MNFRAILMIWAVILLSGFSSAVCTVNLDKVIYSEGDSATVTMQCSENGEKNIAYSVNWTNATGFQIELDTGTTPPKAGNSFFASFSINSSYVATYGTQINASLIGAGLEGSDNSTVQAVQADDLIISSITFSQATDIFLGKGLGVQIEVVDENAKQISGAQCRVILEDGNNFPILSESVETHVGMAVADFMLDVDSFDESRDYVAVVLCYCSSNSSSDACIDEDGLLLDSSSGSRQEAFTINQWLTSNTVTDASVYSMKEEIFICANLSNVAYDDRVGVEIYHEARCSAGADDNFDTDRALILSDFDSPDLRGISANTTQMQCKRFVIPEPRYLQGRTSECYASTDVNVIDENEHHITSYHTTSPLFNISSDELNIIPDWERIDDYVFNSIINLSADTFKDYNGTVVGNLDVKLSSLILSLSSEEQRKIGGTNLDTLILTQYIANMTATNITGGSVIPHLEYLEDAALEIELRDVDITPDGWFNVTLYLNSFEERQTAALEGIDNKTGTFHLDVDCPSYGVLGNDMDCTITAYIEDEQLSQKEVDFTCYITDGFIEYSSLNFNQMVTKSPLSITRTFAVPSSFNSGQQYVLQCHADYYNFGSRRDSFYDTFIASLTGGGSGGGDGGIGRSPITGGAIGGGDGDVGIGDIVNWLNPFSPERNWVFVIVEVIVLVGLIGLLLSAVRNKKKMVHHHYPHKDSWTGSIKIVGVVLLGLVVVGGLVVGAIYGYGYVKHSIVVVQESPVNYSGGGQAYYAGNYSILQDGLFRTILLVGFIVCMVIILFKALNIRGEIIFGGEQGGARYRDDKRSSRLQRKINRAVLKNELKRARAGRN